MRKYILLLARLFGRISRLLFDYGFSGDSPEAVRASVVNSTKYSMMTALDEPYYASQYWGIIRPFLDEFGADATILDLGCSQGRFTVRIAEFFESGHIVACDISDTALIEARQHASDAGVNDRIEFRHEAIDDCISRYSQNTVEIIFMTEVTFFYPNWRHDLVKLVSILKPGGLIIMSFRSRYFNALMLTRARSFDKFDLLTSYSDGRIFDSSTVFSWQSSSEVRGILVEEHGLDLLHLSGIGVCSGIPGDPHDVICRPSQLDNRQQQELTQMETLLGLSVPDAGRYMLAIARKPSQ